MTLGGNTMYKWELGLASLWKSSRGALDSKVHKDVEGRQHVSADPHDRESDANNPSKKLSCFRGLHKYFLHFLFSLKAVRAIFP